MANPIRSKSNLTSFIFNQCCFCCTLRTGAMAIGIFQLVVSILWIISVSQERGAAYANVLTVILCFIAGVLIVMGVNKKAAEKLWWGVYLHLIIVIWAVILTIGFFISAHWGTAVGILINAIIDFYFAMIVRSYAFEVEDSATGMTNA